MSTTSQSFQNPLPQSGWVLDVHLAESIGVTRETLVDWLVKYSIPHRRPGTRVFVHMETFFNGLPEGLTVEEKKGK